MAQTHIIYLTDSSFNIGYVGENQAVTFFFNIKDWVEEYGIGFPTLLLSRPGEEEITYPVITTLEDGYVKWVVSSNETTFSGEGKAQLTYLINDILVKSKVFKIIIDKSMTENSQPPKSEKPWVDAVILAGEKAENAMAHSPKILPQDETGTWFVWDANKNEYIDTQIPAVGPEGKPGESAKNYAFDINIPKEAWQDKSCAISIEDLPSSGYICTIVPQNDSDFIPLFINKINLTDSILDDTHIIYLTCDSYPTADIHLQLTALEANNLINSPTTLRILLNYKTIESIIHFIDVVNEKERVTTYDGGSSKMTL